MTTHKPGGCADPGCGYLPDCRGNDRVLRAGHSAMTSVCRAYLPRQDGRPLEACTCCGHQRNEHPFIPIADQDDATLRFGLMELD